MPPHRPIIIALERLLFVAILLLVPACLYVIFAVVPMEQKMGVVQRIFYFHVPAAFSAFLGVSIGAVSRGLYLETLPLQEDTQKLAHPRFVIDD